MLCGALVVNQTTRWKVACASVTFLDLQATPTVRWTAVAKTTTTARDVAKGKVRKARTEKTLKARAKGKTARTTKARTAILTAKTATTARKVYTSLAIVAVFAVRIAVLACTVLPCVLFVLYLETV